MENNMTLDNFFKMTIGIALTEYIKTNKDKLILEINKFENSLTDDACRNSAIFRLNDLIKSDMSIEECIFQTTRQSMLYKSMENMTKIEEILNYFNSLQSKEKEDFIKNLMIDIKEKTISYYSYNLLKEKGFIV